MSPDVFADVLAGYTLGLGTSVIPGPIVFLLIVETIRYGWRAGAAVAAGPVIIDAAVMLPLALVLQGMLASRSLQIALSLVGMVFLLYLGISTMVTAARPAGPDETLGFKATRPFQSFKRALTAQLLSPMAYVFWATVGAVMVRQAYESGGLASGLAFPAAFWAGTLTVASGIVAAAAAGRNVLKSGAYRIVVASGGFLLAVFGVVLPARIILGWR